MCLGKGSEAAPQFVRGKSLDQESRANLNQVTISHHQSPQVGCGERGNEMAEVLTDFPELTTLIDGKAR